MAADIPENEPLEARAGDTWKWTRSLSDYPASTWTLYYRFKNETTGFEITASASGDDYSVTVASSTTATVQAGDYAWVAWVVSGAEKFTIDSGTLKVLPDLRLGTATAPLDTRSHARKALAAIEAVLENRATQDQESYTINGRSLTRTPVAELWKMRSRYKNEVLAEIAADKLANGLGGGRTIGVRF